MVLGPIEIVTLVFPGSHFNGDVLPQLTALVDTGTITIADGLFVTKGEDGAVDIVEIDDETDDALGSLGSLIHEANGLLSHDDATELTSDLAPGDSAVVLIFEHTWVVPLRDAVVASGGYLADTVRVPGVVVEEVLESLAS